MSAGCNVAHYNLVTGHAYTMLGAIKLSGGPELVKMRNPHAEENYTGPFRDDDPQWTAQWKEEAGLVVANDGTFFIPVDDFRQAFNEYTISMYQDWHTSKTEVNKSGQDFGFKLKSPVD